MQPAIENILPVMKVALTRQLTFRCPQWLTSLTIDLINLIEGGIIGIFLTNLAYKPSSWNNSS